MKWKIVLFVIFNVFIALTYTYFMPDTVSEIALNQFEEGAAATRTAIEAENYFNLIIVLINVLLIAWIVWNPITKLLKGAKGMKKVTVLFMLLGITLMFTGCKPYEEPVYEDIGNSETAYLIELEDDGGVKYDSAEALDEKKVAARRVQIDRRWNKTGRMPWTGEYIPTVRVVKVDRAPVTREWTAEIENGTIKKDQGIWVESKDSIGFSTGFNCTAYVKEVDASTFLYFYPSVTSQGESRLAQVMDDEIRNKIQEVAADFSAGFDLDDLREQKQAMITKVRAEVIPFFKERGITVTTIGMFGGLSYENKNIQASIDEVFIAQQLKNQESAKLEAMASKEERLKREGIATANQRREEAQGEADAVELAAEAEANAITLINGALKEAQSNPLFIQVKALEVETTRINRWNGSVPSFVMGSDGGGFVPMIQIPESASSPK